MLPTDKNYGSLSWLMEDWFFSGLGKKVLGFSTSIILPLSAIVIIPMSAAGVIDTNRRMEQGHSEAEIEREYATLVSPIGKVVDYSSRPGRELVYLLRS